MGVNFNDQLAAALATLAGGGSYLFLAPWSNQQYQAFKARWGALLCEHASGLKACGHCPVCRARAVIRAAAIFETVERPLSIETIRALKTSLGLKPLVGERRLAALAHFESATLAAQNALLKILEEPPPTAIFLLLARQRTGILPTVLSRVAIFELGGAPASPAAATLAFPDLLARSLAERFKQLEQWLAAATPAAAETLLADWAMAIRKAPALAPARRLKLLKRLRDLTAQLRRDQTTGLKLALESLIAQFKP